MFNIDEKSLLSLPEPFRAYEKSRKAFHDLSFHSEGRHKPLWVSTGKLQKEPIYTHYIGPDRPQSVLIHVNATHGVERDAADPIQSNIVAGKIRVPNHSGVLVINCLNPSGARESSRYNHNRVDLNRNADKETYSLRFSKNYRICHKLFNPSTRDELKDSLSIFDAVFGKGERKEINLGSLESSDLKEFITSFNGNLKKLGGAILEALALGQHEDPNSIMFGGNKKEDNLIVLEEVLGVDGFRSVKNLVLIDVHSGLGEKGSSNLFINQSCSDSSVESEFSKLGFKNLTEAIPYADKVRGAIFEEIFSYFPHANKFSIAQEFGTVSINDALKTLVEEGFLFNQETVEIKDQQNIKAKKRIVFSPQEKKLRLGFRRYGLELASKALTFLDSINK